MVNGAIVAVAGGVAANQTAHILAESKDRRDAREANKPKPVERVSREACEHDFVAEGKFGEKCLAGCGWLRRRAM